MFEQFWAKAAEKFFERLSRQSGLRFRLQCRPTTCPGNHLSLTFRSAELTTEAQCPLCIKLIKNRSRIQVSGATSLSSLQDTQKKLKKVGEIERFPTNNEFRTSSAKNGLSKSTIEDKGRERDKRGQRVEEGRSIKCDKVKPVGGVNETKHQTK